MTRSAKRWRLDRKLSCGIVAKWKLATERSEAELLLDALDHAARTVSGEPTATKPFSISVSIVIPPATRPDFEAMMRAIDSGET